MYALYNGDMCCAFGGHVFVLLHLVLQHSAVVMPRERAITRVHRCRFAVDHLMPSLDVQCSQMCAFVVH